MSNNAVGWAAMPIWVLRSDRIHRDAKWLYLHIASRVGDSDLSWPSQSRLVVESGLSESSVRRRLRELEQAGLIETQMTTTATGRRNTYRVLVHPTGVRSQ